MIDELTPKGPVELNIVLTIARLLWRKENLSSFETAKLINFRYRQIFEAKKKSRGKSSSVNGELEETMRAAQKQARSELGDDWDWDRFIDDDFGTIERLMRDLQLAEQLDAIIDKCLKRLLLVRGVKSVALAPPSKPPEIHKPRDVNLPAKDQVQIQVPPEAAATVQGQGPREAEHSNENREVRDQARTDPPDLPRYLTATQVCLRHSERSPTWLKRLMERDPTFPKPIMPGRQRLWALAELEAWELRQAAGDAAKTKEGNPGAGLLTAHAASAEMPNGGGAEDRLNPGQGTAEPTLVPSPHEFRTRTDNN